MARKQRSSVENTSLVWLQNTWGKWIAAMAGFSAIFGAGYTVAEFKKDLEHQNEIVNIKQEYSEKLHEAIDACRKEKENDTREKLSDLTKVVERIQKGQSKNEE